MTASTSAGASTWFVALSYCISLALFPGFARIPLIRRYRHCFSSPLPRTRYAYSFVAVIHCLPYRICCRARSSSHPPCFLPDGANLQSPLSGSTFAAAFRGGVSVARCPRQVPGGRRGKMRVRSRKSDMWNERTNDQEAVRRRELWPPASPSSKGN
jgi:hypothetical protein